MTSERHGHAQVHAAAHAEALAPWDVVTVPFPFTDRRAVKRRPALVLSSAELSAHSKTVVLAMITSAENAAWPHDVAIGDLAATGLTAASLVRWKLFTLDHSIVRARIGRLEPGDQGAVRRAMHKALAPAAAARRRNGDSVNAETAG
ncbi:MAG: type II toxin-antitoxin system PemK/MazF family toxin [Gemmatimonadales bacterium]